MCATLALLTMVLWRAELSVGAHHIEEAASAGRAAAWILWGGLAGSLLAGGITYLALVHRNRDYEQTRRYLQALESLQAVSSKIIGQIETGGDALAELCESGRRLLRMDRAGIQLLHAQARAARAARVGGRHARRPAAVLPPR